MKNRLMLASLAILASHSAPKSVNYRATDMIHIVFFVLIQGLTM